MESNTLFAALNTRFPEGKVDGHTISTAALTLVAIKLAAVANGLGTCWPGQERLAEETGLDVRTIQRALALHESRGLFTKEMRDAYASYFYTFRKAVRPEGGRWQFEGWGVKEPIGIMEQSEGGLKPPRSQTRRSQTRGGMVSDQGGGGLGSEKQAVSDRTNDQCMNDPLKDPSNGPPAGGLAESNPTKAKLKSQSPEPVTPSPVDTLAIILAKKFWEWQGKPAKYRVNSS